MLDIQPKYLTLSELLDRRLFFIPDYQRAYSWTTRQREDLFDDIKKVHSKGARNDHFMATVVCLRHKKKQMLGTNPFQRVDVVDGQQRLTTLIILLNSIKLALNPDKDKEKKLARELGELLVKVEGKELLLLQTNHDSSHHFATFLREGTADPSDGAETVADRELLKAIEECQKFVSDWKGQGGKLAALAALLKNRLSFLLHEIGRERSVYTVFEVLNSRGMEVSRLDRLKSILMGAAFELKKVDQRGLIKDLHRTWRDIYAVIGLRQGMSTETLRFAATLWMDTAPRRLLGEQESVDLLSQAYNAGKIREVASWLLDVTKACDSVMKNPRRDAVTRISQARLLATAIHLKKNLKADDRKALLTHWEKVSFRIYGLLNRDARTGVGDYVRLAWDIIHKPSLSPQSIHNSLKEIGTDSPIKDAVYKMRNADRYNGWREKLRYFMCRYEEHLAGKQKLNYKNAHWKKIWNESPEESIEHIWAQSKAPEPVKHTLGNLMLLPPNLNSTLQDKHPKDKIEAYRGTGLLIAGEVAAMLEKNHRWSRKSIKEREAKILKWAAVEWAD